MNQLRAGCLAECPPRTERGTGNGGRPALSRERPFTSPGDLPKACAATPPVAGPADVCGRAFGVAGRGRTRADDIMDRPEDRQGSSSQGDLVQQILRAESGVAEICFSLRIQTIRLERLPCIAPGCCHGNALPLCIGSPPAAATVLGPAKPAGVQVFATAAPIGICLIIIQFRESPGNNAITPSGRLQSRSPVPKSPLP